MENVKGPSVLARAGKVDIRVDEEQSAKLGEIIQILINAGYYRANIKGLSPFDKIVGGVTWCIEVCNYDIDVDLLFHDSLTIGQKITLTEKIVKVLPFMKCPHRIEPHQIQGLDAIHIFPVIKWLVNEAAETRAEYQDKLRVIALDQFNRQYGKGYTDAPSDYQMNLYCKLKMKYGPKHRFKKKPDYEILNPNEKVLMTLMEYSEMENAQVFRNFREFAVDDEDAGKLNSKTVGVALSQQIRDIASTTQNFQENNLKNESLSLVEVISTLQKQKDDLNTKIKETSLKLQEKKDKNKERIIILSDAKKFLDASKEEIQLFNSTQNSICKEQVEELNTLLEANEEVKCKISEFKNNCQEKAERMQKEISELQNQLELKKSEVVGQELIDVHSNEKENYLKFRSELSKKTRDIEKLKRIVDSTPGRAELSQYQRRFIELYNIISAKHHETLQFYNMYNTLADSKFYMEKELGLLNSILDNMEQGLSSPASLGEYVYQLDSIVEGIKQSKKKLEQKRTDAKDERTSLSLELSRLQELQLYYAKQIHSFSQEIAKNEMLLKMLDGRH